LFKALANEADNEHAMIDSTIVRAHQHSAGARKKGNQSIGAAKGGLSTKMHTTIDAPGNPTGFTLSSGTSS